MEKSNENRLEEIQNEVFGNSLVVGRICSYASLADVLNLRLVNHLFQREATKSLRKVHKHIVLRTNQRIQALYELMEKRRTLRLTPFPFSAFNLELSLSQKTLQIFSQRIGKYIQRYTFQAAASWRHSRSSVQIGGKVVRLLSRSQQLTEFLLDSTYEVYVSEQDLVHVANYFPCLRVIGMESREHGARDPPGSPYPLIDVLVSRAWGLKVFKIPAALPDLSLRNIQFLVQNRPNNLPYFALEESQSLLVYSDDTSVVQTLIDRNVRFREISVVVRENQCQPYRAPTASVEEVRNLVEIVSTWLELQSGSLKNLCIELIYHSRKGGPFPFPSLPVLENLSIKFPPGTRSTIVLPLNSRPVEPFIDNPFPALRKLCLDGYRNDFGIFGIGSMASVRTLELRGYISPFPAMNCHLTFPNLTTLHIGIKPAARYRDTLIYVLTHLTQLVNLDLEETAIKDEHTGGGRPDVVYDYWHILTGGAPGSYRNSVLSGTGTGGWDTGAPEEPVNGIYQVPSLRNMTALQSLRLYPRRGSNLDAILFMSQTGQLVPLQKLTVSCPLQDMWATELYRQGLSQIHKEVHFLWRFPSRSM